MVLSRRIAIWRCLRTHGPAVYTHVERFPGWPHGNRTQWSRFRWAQGQKSDVGIPPRLCTTGVLSLLHYSAPYGSSMLRESFIETILPTLSLPLRDRSGVIHYFHGLHWFWPSVWLQVPFALDGRVQMHFYYRFCPFYSWDQRRPRRLEIILARYDLLSKWTRETSCCSG